MNLLAIETASDSCSAAVLSGDEVFAVSEVAPRRHNELILSMCEEVLAHAQLSLAQIDAVAFGRGPGAFTGVRLAASVTQGIAMAQDLPVVPVSSLAALAQAAYHSHKAPQIFSCMDARMQEVYCALFEPTEFEIVQCIGEEQVIKPERIEIVVNQDCYGVGSGWRPYAKILLERCGNSIAFDADALPQAQFVATLAKHYFAQGKSVFAIEALPVYLRDNVVKKPNLPSD